MSATPRTDAEEMQRGGDGAYYDYVKADFARELERELQEAQAKLQWFMENQNQIAMDVIRPVEEENARLRRLLRLAVRQDGGDRSGSWYDDAVKILGEG